jgi:hypothetical protein
VLDEDKLIGAMKLGITPESVKSRQGAKPLPSKPVGRVPVTPR